jgi:hypothetical protein
MKVKFQLIFLILIALTFSISAQTKEAQIFADFNEYTCDEVIVRLQDFKVALVGEPKSKGYIIVYDGKHQEYLGEKKEFRYRLPIKGEATALLNTIKKRWGFLGYPLEDITVVFGGFREVRQIQFWIVPPNATFPKPKPTLERIKYRKGKPQDICYQFG